jgi:hypothetical protein
MKKNIVFMIFLSSIYFSIQASEFRGRGQRRVEVVGDFGGTPKLSRQPTPMSPLSSSFKKRRRSDAAPPPRLAPLDTSRRQITYEVPKGSRSAPTLPPLPSEGHVKPSSSEPRVRKFRPLQFPVLPVGVECSVYCPQNSFKDELSALSVRTINSGGGSSGSEAGEDSDSAICVRGSSADSDTGGHTYFTVTAIVSKLQAMRLDLQDLQKGNRGITDNEITVQTTIEDLIESHGMAITILSTLDR